MISSRMFRTTLSIVLLCMVVPVLLVGFSAAALTGRSSEASFHEERTQQLILLQNTCNLLLDESGFIFQQLMQDENAILALDYEGLTLPVSYHQLQNIQAFRKNMDLIASSRPFLHDILVYKENPYGLFISSADSLGRLSGHTDTGWYAAYLANRDKQMHAQVRETARMGQVVTVCFFMRGVSQRGNGAMVFNFYRASLEQLLPRDGTDWLVLQDTGELLFGSVGGGLPSMALRDELLAMPSGAFIYPDSLPGKVLYQVESQAYGWRYVNIADRTMLTEAANGLNLSIIVVAGLSLLAGVLIAVLMTRASVRPIARILRLIEGMGRDGGLPPEEGKRDEYEIISYNLLQNHLSQQRLKEELSQRKLRLREAEMLALQTQINPHFLYNTMEIINWRAIAALGDTNAISHMITTLSDLLRYALERPEVPVPFHREMAHGQQYAELMTFRLGPLFTVTWDVAPAYREAKVPKLILQPLIENAIQHGIQEMDGDGVIDITARVAAGTMYLTVTDNGAGMPPDLLQTLRGQLKGFDGLQYAHIGLLNVYQRVRLMTDDKAEMTLDSTLGEGTRVTLVFPLQDKGGVLDADHS